MGGWKNSALQRPVMLECPWGRALHVNWNTFPIVHQVNLRSNRRVPARGCQDAADRATCPVTLMCMARRRVEEQQTGWTRQKKVAAGQQTWTRQDDLLWAGLARALAAGRPCAGLAWPRTHCMHSNGSPSRSPAPDPMILSLSRSNYLSVCCAAMPERQLVTCSPACTRCPTDEQTCQENRAGLSERLLRTEGLAV